MNCELCCFVVVVKGWNIIYSMLHCRVVCRFPLGVFEIVLADCVDMTKAALLGCGESAD